MARKDDARAALFFREAILSPNFGYTRSNYELAAVYLRLKRADEAIAILQAAHRTGLAGSNLYVTRTELSERLAEAFEAAGQRDSAAAYYAAVGNAWEKADPEWRPRRDRARQKAAELRPAS